MPQLSLKQETSVSPGKASILKDFPGKGGLALASRLCGYMTYATRQWQKSQVYMTGVTQSLCKEVELG